MRNSLNRLIGGEAGQGLVTIGQVLTKALTHAGYHILVTQDYMSRVRGGHNTFAIRVSTAPLLAPRQGMDLLVALDQETLDRHAAALNPGASVVADQGLTCGLAPCYNLPYAELAPKRYLNTVALGACASLLGLSQELVATSLAKFLGKKLAPEEAAANRAALAAAYDYAAQNPTSFEGLAPPAPTPGTRMVIGGNEAIALGALAAGLKFLAFYPMTPATSVALTVIAHAAKMGVVCEQAEDEIAAINMALGAAYAGAPALVPTSGGGFALMVEGVSLAAMTETPIVIVLAMRPGPATGLPTRTEQADLEMVLHAGHGEFPRAIYAPGDLEECFALTYRAMHAAERFQSPVFLLTDQFLADSLRGVPPFDLSGLTPVKAGATLPKTGAAYQRYAITLDGVSPRALPGMGPELVVADSDEHTPDGHITENLGVRVEMMDKRLRKHQGLLAEALPPIFSGPAEPDLLLAGWGSTKGSILEAAQDLTTQGRIVATCHFPQVWPLNPDHFLPRLSAAREVVMVEGNASGQLARLIRRETGFHIQRRILRYDGLPITPECILRSLDN
jgi:2-oxoglutarate ferredoxin oxidoreductase subunit alpha